ncbi:vacuolar protein sorting-associated protein 16B [Aricia agestis]|uniref:vacuolar protein sorting-associated protein 16B n=1 Tax=Aricia agestis TaxID=91739 RepID=UPI001C2094F0|nr:vacuolar protein sorting-associated protein 16B [Aricia agestis]
MDDDDYWNTSETKENAFNFDDDVLSPKEILAIGQKPISGQSDNIFSSVAVTLKANQLPLSSLISLKVLDLLILAQSGKDPKDVKPETDHSVAATLKRLVLGRSVSLHCHRSLKSKTELIDGAVALGDGNVILTVVLFLIQTLNKKLVYELLNSRPLALSHYIGFLQSEGKITELTDLLTMLGRSPEAAVYQLQHLVRTQGTNVEVLLRKVTNLASNHFNQPGVDAHQLKMVNDYVKLLEWQKCVNKPALNNASPLTCLAHCCTNHWHEGAGNMMSPLTLCQRQQIAPVQYEWVVLNVHAGAAKWDIVESLFSKKDWLGRSSVSSHMAPQTLLARLQQLQAPSRLLAAALAVLPTDERLRLAQHYKVHSVVIEMLHKQKDRAALTNYKMTLSPQSEEYILAENTLRDTSVKWKN